ncbi:uncharacterized protein [Diadema setosum]|uniref:uncharacterized protein n=1 Tax=Diadema setosum TaxID=31175 RepID=UPI003B3BCDC0
MAEDTNTRRYAGYSPQPRWASVSAAINALPTADNLSRWGKRLNTRCTLCGNHETLLHILNNCKSALEQGRCNYRHNSILQYLVSFIGKVKPDKVICHADLPGHDINGGTVPSDLTPTSERPDIVLVNQSSKSVVIGELTVPFKSNIDSAHNRKSEKYASLVLDIENQGYSFELICFEVGSRGLLTKENKRQVTKLFKFVSDTRRIREHIRTISKIAILTSFAIYNARNEPSWTKPAYLQPKEGHSFRACPVSFAAKLKVTSEWTDVKGGSDSNSEGGEHGRRKEEQCVGSTNSAEGVTPEGKERADEEDPKPSTSGEGGSNTPQTSASGKSSTQQKEQGP